MATYSLRNNYLPAGYIFPIEKKSIFKYTLLSKNFLQKIQNGILPVQADRPFFTAKKINERNSLLS
jgi:hypothetical protein